MNPCQIGIFLDLESSVVLVCELRFEGLRVSGLPTPESVGDGFEEALSWLSLQVFHPLVDRFTHTNLVMVHGAGN